MNLKLSCNSNHLGTSKSSRTVSGLELAEVTYKPRAEIPKHSHDKAGFSLVLSGKYIENYGNRVLECSRQTVTFSPAGEPHFNRFHSAASHCFVIGVDAWWLDRVRDYGVVLNKPSHFRSGSLTWLASRIYHEYGNSDEASPLIIEALFLEILVEASRRSRTVSERKPPRWLLDARSFIREHYLLKFSLLDLASSVGVHPVHLASEFRRHYHCTIGECVRRQRIEFACRELKKNEASLVEIALAAGFASQSHFSSLFKRATGMTPASYRASAGVS